MRVSLRARKGSDAERPVPTQRWSACPRSGHRGSCLFDAKCVERGGESSDGVGALLLRVRSRGEYDDRAVDVEDTERFDLIGFVVRPAQFAVWTACGAVLPAAE